MRASCNLGLGTDFMTIHFMDLLLLPPSISEIDYWISLSYGNIFTWNDVSKFSPITGGLSL